ncbi:MAG: hypothetical protein IJ160_04115 [Muribaculaceae bacterium]|nr:hypothetical protein [Muribaculaceae bacterium]
MRSVLCIFLGVLAVLAVARTRTTQKQLHSSAAIVQTLDITEVDSVDLTDGVDPGGIVMKGYSKRAADSKESFFLTSKLKHRISSVRLLLRYSAMDGTVLHERRVVVPVELKPGETRLVTVKSFDVQHLFYYYGGNKPRKSATPYKVAYRLTGYDIPVGN